MSNKVWFVLGIVLAGLVITFWLGTRPMKAEATQLQCRHENAECQINAEGSNCCAGLVCGDFNEQSGNGKCQEPGVTVTPTETPTVTPTAEVTPEVTQAPNQGGPGDGRSDGRSDGQHQGPDGLGCAAHECKDVTFANTGSEDGLMNVIGVVGGLYTVLGMVLLKR